MRTRAPALIKFMSAAALSAALAVQFAPTATAAPAIAALTPGTSWNWQISSTPTDADVAIVGNLSNPKKMLDIDGENATAALITKIKAAGIVAICYIETGAIENYRSDYSSFPSSSWGNSMPGYPDEHYLDIRQPVVLAGMKARIDGMAAKGCDGIEPDIDDSFLEGSATTGLPLTEAIQVAYNTTLINYAHSKGMSMGLKNGADPQFVADMAPVADWALNEQCNQYSECGPYSAFIGRNKAVFQVEYSTPTSSFCAQDNAANYDGLKKATSLTATPRTACRLDQIGPGPTPGPSTTTTSTTAAPSTTTSTTTTDRAAAPAAPNNVRAAVSGTRVTLTWDASRTATVVRYAIFDGGTEITQVTTNRAVLNRQQHRTHLYQVQAIDQAGNRSPTTTDIHVTL